MRPFKTLLIAAVVAGGVGLTALAARPEAPRPSDQAPEYLKPLIRRIESAPTVEAALDAFGRARLIDPDGPFLKKALLHRMIALQQPLSAYEQALSLTAGGTSDGRAWAVVAMMRARLGQTSGALEALVRGVETGGEDAFVLATAGELLADVEGREFKPALSEDLSARLASARQALRARPAFVEAFARAQARAQPPPPTPGPAPAGKVDDARAVAMDRRARRETESRREAHEIAALYAPLPPAELYADGAPRHPPANGSAACQTRREAAYRDYAASVGAYSAAGAYGNIGPSGHFGYPAAVTNFIIFGGNSREEEHDPGPIVRDGLVVRRLNNPASPVSSSEVRQVFQRGTGLSVRPFTFAPSGGSSGGSLRTFGGLVGTGTGGSPLIGGRGADRGGSGGRGLLLGGGGGRLGG